jgi:cation-transporting ATPase E
MLDPTNLVATSMAFGIGVLAAGLIELIWWVQGAMLGEQRRLWRSASA